MCFEFGSCFGNGRREDYGGERTPRGRGRRADHHRNGYYSGADHKARTPAPAHQHQPHAAAVDEVGQKAYHDGVRKDHHTDAGGHGYAAYVHDKAANDTPKLPAWQHNKVGDDAGHTYTNTARLHESGADRRENSAVDYHHYPTTTTNTTLVRY